jgi:O-antigen ligase
MSMAEADTNAHIGVIPALARVTVIALIAYTALTMALADSTVNFDNLIQFNVGPVNVYLFDMLLVATVFLLFSEARSADSQPIPPANRAVVFLVFGYCAYQIAIILPVSVIFHDFDAISVIRDIEDRTALILIPFVYLVGLKYLTPRRLVLLVNTAAVLLALYAIYKYATVGPIYDSGTRLRELWGGATLLFGFLVLTSIFLSPAGWRSYGAAMLGLAGIALTNHRSGYLALLVVVIPLFFHFRRASMRMVTIVFVVAVAATFVLGYSPAIRQSAFYSVRTMLDPSADQTSSDRLDRSKLGLDYFVAHPLGDYAWNQQYYLVDLGPDAFEPHNFIVQLLDEQGIVGLAMVGAVAFLTVRIGWRNRMADRMSAVMLACLAFYLFFNLFNTNLLNQWNIMLFAVPAGVILARNSTLRASGSQQPSIAATARH